MHQTFKRKLLPHLIATMIIPGIALAEESSTTLESVSVTANKIEENIEDVPQAITVIDAYELEEKGIKSVPDLLETIPNMNLNNNGGTRVGFRGLSSSVFTQTNPVVIYIDGVPTNKIFGFDANLSNVERVEVLRGPQGTLYGKDAIGAIINIVTKEPNNQWGGSIGAEVGNQNSRLVSFNTSGPLIENKLYAGINGQKSMDDGWIENTYPGADKHADKEERTNLDTFLLFKPTDNFKAKLNLKHDAKTTGSRPGYVIAPGENPKISDFSRSTAEKTSEDVTTREETITNSQSLDLNYVADDFTVTATTVHKRSDVDGIYDADFNDNAGYLGLTQFMGLETDTWSQEIRFNSNNEEGMRWVAGIYLEEEDNLQAPYGWQFPYWADTDSDGIPETFYGNFEQNISSDQLNTTKALFGQIMLPMSENLELTLGLRAQQYTAKSDLNAYWYLVGDSASADNRTNGFKDSTTWDSLLPKVALRYQVQPNINTYASYSRGVMQGGYNTFASGPTGNDAEANRFEPQYSDTYEIGVKANFDDLSVAANIFYNDITDIHVYQGTGFVYVTDNAKKAHSQGVELEFRWNATDSLQVSGSLGLMDAKYDDYNVGGVDLSGQNLIESPTHSANLGFSYESSEDWYSRLDITNYGKTYFYDDASKSNEADNGYTVVNLKAGYRMGDLDLYAYAYNLTDDEYVAGYMASGMIGGYATFGDPRTFGIGAKLNF